MIHPNRTTCAPDEAVLSALLHSGDFVGDVARTFLEIGFSAAETVDVLRHGRFRRDVVAIDRAYATDAALLVQEVEAYAARVGQHGQGD